MAIIVDKVEKKKALLKAAIRVFSRKGTADTKIQDIAEEAGIAKGTIYLYFKDKDEILQNIIEQLSFGENLDLLKILKSPGDPKAKLNQLLFDITETSVNQDYAPGFHFEILSIVLRNTSNLEFEKNITRTQMVITSLLLQMNIDGLNKESALEIAAGLISLLHGSLLFSAIKKNSDYTRNIISTVLDQLIK